MLRFLYLALMLSFNQQIFADATPANAPLTSEQVKFDVAAANKDFDKMNLNLSTKGQDQAALKKAVKTLKSQLNSAEECISVNDKKVANIDSKIQEIKQSEQITDTENKETIVNKSAADLVYLTNERKKLADKLGQCRLFYIRANEALEVYELTLSRIQKEKILEHGKPFWYNINLLFSKEIIITKTPVTIFDITNNSMYPKGLYIVFITSFLLSVIIFYTSRKNQWVRKYINFKKIYLRSFLLLFFSLVLFLSSGYLCFLYYNLHAVNFLLLWLSSVVSIYTFSLFCIFLFYNIKKIKAFFCWYSLDYNFFKLLTILIATLYASAIIGKNLAINLNINNLIWKIAQSIFLYIELAIAIILVFLFCRAHRQISFIKIYKNIIKTISTLMFLTFATLNLIGYNLLSVHLTVSGILTFAIIFATIILEQAISKFYSLCTNDGPINKKLQYIFGYKSGQTMTEFLILKSTIQIIIFFGSVYFITKSWGYALNSIDLAFEYILNGIKFATFTFHPARIVSGVVAFCVLYLIFRCISTYISRHEQFDGEEETQVAIASILTYIGFGVAIISGLLIAGFDFTGLAIVAGALSVGIGLGLQSIVNNFVSGLILLIEKPIKPGDRISIDGIEGYVKKIRVRSTQLLTPQREDMIIPNSDLITRRVTNFMYSDKHLTISCEVGIDYDSDLDLVIPLLIDIACKHPEVITNVKNNKPRVLIISFGENSVLLRLSFLIKDGNKKIAVRSEIYFEILKAFKNNDINIAYPRRDIHIKMENIKILKDV